MSVRMVRRNPLKDDGKRMIRVSTEVYVEEYVDVEADVDLEEFVSRLKPDDRALLLRALSAGSDQPACEGGVHPQDAYYAMARGDLETVRRFVCEAAGRIA